MFVLKIISIVAICLSIVTCSELKVKRLSVTQVKRSTININDEPTGGVSIPVALVYEEGHRKANAPDVSDVRNFYNKSVKSKDHLVNEETKNESEVKLGKLTSSVNFKDPSLTKVTEIKASLEKNTTKISKSIDILKNQNEFHIPVAVIYDSESNHRKLISQKHNSIQRSVRKRSSNSDDVSVGRQTTTRTKIQSRVNNERKSEYDLRGHKPRVPIIMSENYVFSHSGDFHYGYESGDGTRAFVSGELKSIDKNAGAAIAGSYSYIGADGNDYSLSYTADENGYRPVGDHLPTPPPIPPAIARALKYLATKTTPQPVTEPTK